MTPEAAGGGGFRFTPVYEEYAEFVDRTFRRLGVRAGDIDDARQELFLVVHRKLETWEGRSSFKTWLFGICLRVASDFRKRAHLRREKGAEEMPLLAVSGEWPIRRITQEQERARLLRLIDSLDEEKRSVLVLFELQGVSMKEIAERTRVPVQTAYARLYAARRALSEAMKRSALEE